MNICTDNYYLARGVQDLLRQHALHAGQALSVIDLSHNQYAIFRRPDCLTGYHCLLESYIDLCAGILSAGELHHFLTRGNGTTASWRKPYPLTAKEMTVITLLLAGYPVREVAVQLHLSDKTIYGLRARAENKLALRHLSQLAVRLHYWERYLPQMENVMLCRLCRPVRHGLMSLKKVARQCPCTAFCADELPGFNVTQPAEFEQGIAGAVDIHAAGIGNDAGTDPGRAQFVAMIP
jgi:DNA-binding CsgD family transcriptional regulator